MQNYIDELKYVISGEDYEINDYIKIHAPYIHEICSFGESLYYHAINLFTRKPYDIAVELYDNGIDYQSITDWDLFYETAPSIPQELSYIIIDGINFADFVPLINRETNMKYLVNKENENIIIDEAIYRQMVTYLRYVHYIREKVEYDVGNSMAKKFLIDRMRRKAKKAEKDYLSGKRKIESKIGNMIKYCVNSSGFKYDYDSVMNIKLCQLYESYHFITHNKERDNVLSGIYHGSIDMSKMKDKSILDIIPDLHK